MKKAASDLSLPPAQARRLLPLNLSDFALPLFIVIYSAIVGVIEPRFLAWDNIENLMSRDRSAAHHVNRPSVHDHNRRA